MSKRVPKRKFKGFKNEWEQCKLGDIISELKSGLSRQLDNADIGLPVVRANNINDGILDMNNDVKYWYKDDPQGADTSNYLIHKNDILINFINSEAKMGTATIVDTEPIRETIYTTNILKMKADDTISDNLFLLYLTMTNHYCDYIKLITKPAVNQASFTTVDYKNYSFMMPSLKEQKKIGVYLNTLDSLITFHQRKYDKLQALKKAYLYEMFPQEGESVPKRRFAGFSGEWEKKKMLEIISVNNGTDYKHLQDGDIPVYGTGGYMCSVNKALSYNEDAIGIGRKGTIDKPYILKAPFWTVDTLFYCIPCKGYNLHFVNDLFQCISWKTLDESTGVPSLSKTIIENVNIRVPSQFEQERIGKFFGNIDKNILKIQNKLQKLKALKQAYLAEMFV